MAKPNTTWLYNNTANDGANTCNAAGGAGGSSSNWIVLDLINDKLMFLDSQQTDGDSRTGTKYSVELYALLADAEAQTNLQASGATTGFGSSLAVTLTNATGAAYPVSLYQSGYAWHLKVSGADGDDTTIFRVKEFIDLDEIDHAVFRNADLIPIRAAFEIDAHTHAKFTRSIQCGRPILDADEGSIGQITSSRRSLSELGQVVTHIISGSPRSLISELEIMT